MMTTAPLGKPGKDAHRQVDYHPGGAHSGQSGLAHKTAHHDRVHGVIELLKKRTEPQGEKEGQQLFPDDPLGDVAAVLPQDTHTTSYPSSSASSSIAPPPRGAAR